MVLTDSLKLFLICRKFIKKRRTVRSTIKKSIFEGIVSRADRSFSRVLLNAYRKGARRDSSSERFNWDIWEAAMKEEGFDWHFCLEAKTENHPWNIIE